VANKPTYGLSLRCFDLVNKNAVEMFCSESEKLLF